LIRDLFKIILSHLTNDASKIYRGGYIKKHTLLTLYLLKSYLSVIRGNNQEKGKGVRLKKKAPKKEKS